MADGTTMPGLRRVIFVLLAVLAVGITACGGGEWEGTEDPGYITQAELGEAWPFEVSEGVLRCRGNGAIEFWAPDDKVYALNAVAEHTGGESMFEILAEDPENPGTFKSLGPIFERC